MRFEVRREDTPPAERGFEARSHVDLSDAQAAKRFHAEAAFLRALTKLPDLQNARILLLFCAASRA